MSFHALDSQSSLHDGYRRVFVVNGIPVLLVQTDGTVYAVENKCGHFGVSLLNAYLDRGRIRCAQHGAEFDLATGAVMNRVVAQCDPLRTFAVVLQGTTVGIEF